MRAIAGLLVIAALSAPAVAWAEDAAAPQSCDPPAFLLSSEYQLPKVAEAVKTDHRLDIMVVGSRSATIASVEGAGFPSRLEAALREKLPGVTVNVNLQLQIKKTAEDVVKEIGSLLEGKKPNLVVWQTGTVDAMRSVDTDDFRSAVDDGVAAMQKNGADVVLMNLQYNPRMDGMIGTSPYIDVMRVVAQQREIPLFDRYGLMHYWNENGSFDLFSSVHGVELAKRVHECLGRALATFVIESAHINPAEPGIQR